MINLKEFQTIKEGDSVKININGNSLWVKALTDAFYNADADEPDWEVETDWGFISWDSVEEVKFMEPYEKLVKTIRHWNPEAKIVEDLTIHQLIVALDQAKCDLFCKREESDPIIPLMIERELNSKLIDLVNNNKWGLKNIRGNVEQVYMLFRPNNYWDINKLIVVVKKHENEYAVGYNYDPDIGTWDCGRYCFESFEGCKSYIAEKYGIAIPLIRK